MVVLNVVKMRVLVVESGKAATKSVSEFFSRQRKDVEVVETQASVKECRDWLQNSENHADMVCMDVESFRNLTECRGDRKGKERIIVRLNDRIVPIPVSNIAYVYSKEKNNYLRTYDDQRYVIDQPLDAVNDDLDQSVFFRISRRCIISIRAIKSVVRQAGGKFCINPEPESSFIMMLSRSRVDDFLAWLDR